MENFVPAVLMSYLSIFEFHFRKPSFIYFQGYVWGLLISRGRKTVTQIARCCFFIDRHLSNWERFLSFNSWDITEVSFTLIEILKEKLGGSLKVHGAYLCCLDTLLIAKNGTKMLGVQKWADHSGNADRGESITGHHWGLIGLISFSVPFSRYLCFPVLMRLIPGQLNPCQFICDPNGIVSIATFWDGVLPLVFQLFEYLKQAPLRVVVDAYFCKVPFLQPLLDKGIFVITRMRKDAVGWDEAVYSGRGRPPKRGKKWKLCELLKYFPKENISVFLYGKIVEIEAVTRVLWIRELKRMVKVVVVSAAKEPIIFLSTDLSLSASQIVEIYGSRFSIELTIRDLKEHFGLADYQCYISSAINRFVHLCCLSFCLFRLILLKENNSEWINQQEQNSQVKESPLSFTRIRKGLQAFAIGKILSDKFKSETNLQKSKIYSDTIIRMAA